jgi:hypothetical protein
MAKVIFGFILGVILTTAVALYEAVKNQAQEHAARDELKGVACQAPPSVLAQYPGLKC